MDEAAPVKAPLPYDYYGEVNAVLYYRVDSAKLFLPCDHYVHSANGLSNKHVQSYLCDNYKDDPVTIYYVTTDVFLF